MDAFLQVFYLPVVRFFVVGGVVYAVGMALLVFLVEKCRMTKGWANLVMLVVTLQLSFLLNNHWTFATVPADNLVEFTQRWVAYCAARVVPISLESLGFMILVNRLRVPYVLASFIVVAAGFVFVYIVSASLIFVER